MSIELPLTQELVDRNIAIFESKFNETVPATDKAFMRALSVWAAAVETGLGKKLVDDGKQNLAITATNNLNTIGADRTLVPDPETAAVLTATVPGTNGVIVPATYSWTNVTTGIRYFAASNATVTGGVATLSLTSEQLGTSGNMEVGETLKISSKISGLSDTATITLVDSLGTSAQDPESFRQEILNDQRTITGGSNVADYRKWGSVVPGVVGIYPYGGLPFGDPGTDAPPDRSIYVEVSTEIDPDGIAPSSVLDDVEEAIITNPETGVENQALGLNNSRLYVVSIRRTPLYTEIRGLDVPPAQLAEIQTEIENALAAFYRGLTPFVEGLDFVGDKNNVTSDPILSRLVQNILDPVGGNFSGLGFGLTPINFISTYELGSGETAKSGGVTFA
jgi:hypothetical protein